MSRNTLDRLALVTLAATFLLTTWRLGFDLTLLRRGFSNLWEFSHDLFPPDWSVLGRTGEALLETIAIAFSGTALGLMLALPSAVVASPLVTNRYVAAAMRLLLAGFRTIPALLWAVLMVIGFGLGPPAGALAIAFYTTGYLGKLFVDTLDGVDKEVVEAVQAIGVRRVLLARYALLPEASHGLIAQALFVFEYNVRSSAILGFVGAGGIGFYMLGYVQSLAYDRLMTTLIITFAAVVLIERLTQLAQRWYVEK